MSAAPYQVILNIIFSFFILGNVVLVHNFLRVCFILKVKVLQIVRLLQLLFRDNDLEIIYTYPSRSKRLKDYLD